MSLFTNCNCPCCSTPMLHHLRHGQEYWFCRQCWQEMPDLSRSLQKNRFPQNQIVNLSPNLIKRSQAVAL
jgi:ribosomal protein L37AE/L43A